MNFGISIIVTFSPMYQQNGDYPFVSGAVNGNALDRSPMRAGPTFNEWNTLINVSEES